MLRVLTSIRMCLCAGLLLAAVMAPARASAEMPDAATLFDYGFKGFTVGAEMGLSVGYIVTGPVYEHEEWRTLVVGMGMGALLGVGTGIFVAITDHSGSGARTGYAMLRDAGYGAVLGAIMGALTGSLLWVAHGSAKDVLKGAAYGTLLGSAAGAAYGLLDSRREPELPSVPMGYRLGEGWALSVAPSPATSGIVATVRGRFE